jgi:hypothetical protein
MAYKKLKYPFERHPSNAEMLADVILRAADKRQLVNVDPEEEFHVGALLNLCRCLGTPGIHPWPSYTPDANLAGDAEPDDEALLAHALLYAAIARGLTEDQLAIDARVGYYDVPSTSTLIELGRKLSEGDVGFGLWDAPEIVATYDGLASLSVEAVYDDGENCEVVNPGDKIAPNLFSIYAVNKQGLSQCVGDFATAADAFRSAGEIARVASKSGLNLSVQGGLRRWCLLDASQPTASAGQALRGNYLSFLRTDKIRYRVPQLAGMVKHEESLSGAVVSEWTAEVRSPLGNFHTHYPMIAVDAFTHEDQRRHAGRPGMPALEADDLRTCIWVINPEMRDQAVKMARDLLHFGETTLNRRQAGLIVSRGARHRILEAKDYAPKPCRIAISPVGRVTKELDDINLAQLLNDAADAFRSQDETLGISMVYDGNWLVVGGIGVLPSSAQGHITLEFETSSAGFLQHGERNEISNVLDRAADDARAGRDSYELHDTTGASIGRLRRVETSVYYSRAKASTFITEALQALKSNSHDGELTARLVAQRAGYESYPDAELPLSFEEFPVLKQSFEHGARAAAKERGVVEQDMQPSM